MFSLGTTDGSSSFTTLVNFTGPNGAYPASGPLLNADGSLTGTTGEGSTGSEGILYHYAAGVLSTRYSFGNHPGQGIYPESQPVADEFGDLFGTAAYGGPMHVRSYGTVYRVTP